MGQPAAQRQRLHAQAAARLRATGGVGSGRGGGSGMDGGQRHRVILPALFFVMGLSTILGSVNFVTTIVCMRAPGLTMFRMPSFTWNIFVTSLLVLLVFPVLAAGLLVPAKSWEG